MVIIEKSSELQRRFFAPLWLCWETSPRQRQFQGYSNKDFLEVGMSRVASDGQSGRDLLQRLALMRNGTQGRSNFSNRSKVNGDCSWWKMWPSVCGRRAQATFLMPSRRFRSWMGLMSVRATVTATKTSATMNKSTAPSFASPISAQFKNKLHETNVWASSHNAQQIQAHLIGLTENLLLLLRHSLESHENIRNEAEIKRRQQRLTKAVTEVTKNGGRVPLTLLMLPILPDVHAGHCKS